MLTVVEATTNYCTDRYRPELSELAEKIQVCAKDAGEASHDALSSAIAAGGYLIKAKKRVFHGKWAPWLKQNFKFSQNTANNWMRLHENRQALIELMNEEPERYMSVNDALHLVSANPRPAPKTKLQKVQKRCDDVMRELHTEEKADAKKLKEILMDHVKNIHGYTRAHIR